MEVIIRQGYILRQSLSLLLEMAISTNLKLMRENARVIWYLNQLPCLLVESSNSYTTGSDSMEVKPYKVSKRTTPSVVPMREKDHKMWPRSWSVQLLSNSHYSYSYTLGTNDRFVFVEYV